MKSIDPTPSPEWPSFPDSATVLPLLQNEPELTVMPLSKAIIKLAGPAMASMLFIMVFQLVDAWWVGKLGAQPLAGVSAAAFLLWSLESVATLVSTGVNALVARFVGEKNLDKASLVIGQGTLLSIFLSLVFSSVGLVYQSRIFSAMGIHADVIKAATDYMAVILIGLVAVFLSFAIDAAFRGMGDTKTPLKLVAAGLSLNIILDPFLIFGIGPFPRMETAGAALATIIAHGFVAVFGIILLQRRKVKIKFHQGLINYDLLWKITRIGAPIAFSGVMFSVSYMFLTRVITRFGPEALAALGLGHRIEGLSYFAAVGFSIASATLVGQNLGAGKPKRAEKAAWLTILYISILLLFLSVLYYFFGGPIIRFFINDAKVIMEGTQYLKIIALFEVFLGFEIVFEGAFSGAGNSLPPMLVAVPITWLRIPLAIYLADIVGMGSSGIWWTIAVTTGLKGILLALWFLRGKWKLKQI
ncbi:MAG: MATE family efflux transporter [Calditrichaeota bacterium]|nr:MATE family efflux transporter [Calditrichota bacterium]